MKALMLELIGAYSKAQDAIDFAGTFFFQRKTPGLAEFVRKGAIERIRDEDRPVLFAALVAELEIPDDFSQFATVFRRAKKVRDLASHAVRIDVIDPDTVEIGKTWIADKDGKTHSQRLTRADLDARLQDCAWLTQCATYVVATSSLTTKTYLGAKRVSFLPPSAEPKDWDGIGYEYVPES